MIIDLIVLAVLAISALISFLRGFIRESLTIIGVVGASAAAYAVGPTFTNMIKGWLGVVDGQPPQKLFDVLPYPLLAQILGYGGIFIIVLIALSIFSHFISEGARALGLGPVDRTFGVVFGLVRGVLLLGLLYLPIHLLVDQKQKDSWFAGSQTYFYLEKVSTTMADYLPNSAKDKMHEAATKAEDTNETRKKLQDLDLLRNQNAAPAPDGTAPQAAPVQGQVTDPNTKNGYTEDFRNNMDRLFEQKTEQHANP